MTLQQKLGLTEGQIPIQGDYRAKMFELRQAGLTLWSPADVMGDRNKVPADHPLWYYYFATDFGIAGTSKKVYVLPHSPNLWALNPKTRTTSGGLPLEVDGSVKVYNRKDMILNKDLGEEKAREHPLWLNFADGDQDRLDQYVENAFRFGKDRFGYDAMMGIFVPAEKQPIERAVVLGGLYFRSRAFGDDRLNGDARFVGGTSW